MYDFTEPVNAGAISAHRWFDLSNSFIEDEVLVEQYTVAVGFPHEDSSIDYESNNVHLAPRAIFGRYEGATVSDLHGLQLEPELTFNPDGMSGSPIFGLSCISQGLCAKLMGVVSNASRTRINFIHNNVIMRYADAILDQT